MNTEIVNIGYLLGLIGGIIAGLLLAYLLVWLIGKLGGKVGVGGKVGRRCNADGYDERQQLARGTAYKRAFFVLMCYVSVVSLLNEFAVVRLFMSFGGMWLGVCISITVFAVTCIAKDAYMSLYENARGIIMMFSAIAILNLICGLSYLTGETALIQDGALATGSVNLMVGVTFLVILAAFICRVIHNKKEQEEDEA